MGGNLTYPQSIITSIKNSSDGGFALSKSEIEKMIQEEIMKEVLKNSVIHSIDEIPIETLNHYVNIVKSQSIFPIHSSVMNKTQSRVVAEWLFCLTISYFAAVLLQFLTQVI